MRKSKSSEDQIIAILKREGSSIRPNSYFFYRSLSTNQFNRNGESPRRFQFLGFAQTESVNAFTGTEGGSPAWSAALGLDPTSGDIKSNHIS
jgi:hypothetical protein